MADLSLIMMEKCDAARCAAPSPATDPSPRATRGTVATLATTHSQPATPGTLARPVVSMVLTEPPPPEPSTNRIRGSRSSLAMRSHMRCLPLMVASAEPPAHGEVIAAHHHRPPVHAAAAEDEVGRREIDQLVPLVVGGAPRRSCRSRGTSPRRPAARCAREWSGARRRAGASRARRRRAPRRTPRADAARPSPASSPWEAMVA